jgi:two-component system, response regulator RegA
MARILVLDDEKDAGILIYRILEDEDYEVFVFTDGEAAIAFAQSASVDLAILDIRLKRMGGLEVLEELKKINPAMHAIIITALPTIKTARRAKELGADQYCVKPIRVDELRELVASIIGVSNREELCRNKWLIWQPLGPLDR